MEDPSPKILRQLIEQALEVCSDIDLLDLIYRLLF
jgi:hypothetical protein